MSANTRKLFGTIHLWMGLLVGIPAAILGVTGIVLMLVHPLPAQVGASIPPDIDRTLALARTAAPKGAVVQQFAPPVAAGQPATVRFAAPRTSENPRGFAAVEIDPATGAIVPPAPPTAAENWMRIMHDLHGNLMVGGREGRQVVGWVGIAMTLMGVTGIVIWWPKPHKWREAFTVKTSGTRRRLLHDLHGAAGIWGLIVFVIVSVTGVLIAFPIGGAPGGGGRQRAANDVPALIDLHVDAAVAAAAAKAPGMGLIDVAMPRGPADTYRIRMAPAGTERSAPPYIVTVSADASTVESVRDPASAPFDERLRAWNRALHMGMGLGWIWWIFVAVSGVLPVLFAITGIWLWLIKRRNKVLMAQQHPAQ